MANNTQKILVIFFIAALSVTACYSGNMEIMCSGELEIEHFYRGQRDYFFREIVLPDSGLYERYLCEKKLDRHAPNELAALKHIEQSVAAPSKVMPLLIVLGRDKQCKAKQFVTAICILGQEHLTPPYLFQYISNGRKAAFTTFDYSHLLKFTKLRHLELYGTNPYKDSFAKIAGLSNLKYLGLHRLCSDDDMRYMTGLSMLKSVNASGTDITGSGLRYLAKLQSLKTLDLRGTKLKDGTLRNLESCKNLETLLLSDTQTDDDDLELLAGMKTLKYLTLHRTNITDEGLETLAKINGLKFVSLYDTNTTKAGYDRLKEQNSSIVLKHDRPKSFKEFMAERLYVRAQTGDYSAQKELVSKSNYGRKKYWFHKQTETLDEFYSSNDGYFPGIVTDDPIDFWAWLLVLKTRAAENPKLKPLSGLNEIMIDYNKELDDIGLIDAQRRAQVYLYLSKNASHEFKIERQPGLPVYQYDFNWLGGKSVDEFRRELHIQSLESYIEKRKDKLDKDRLEFIQNKLKELKNRNVKE